MNVNLQTEIEIDGEFHPIRNKGDYRVVLDVLAVLNDVELTEKQRIEGALIIFFEDAYKIKNYQTAINEMMIFINNGEEETQTSTKAPIMDWEKDFKLLVAPLNKVLGFEVRSVEYLHWWSFLSGYMEIGESTFQTVISIRKKRQKGAKLEKWELEFFNENRKMIELPQRITAEEKELLESEW
jgi:hypothetical protein